jgi:hypothetical protein
MADRLLEPEVARHQREQTAALVRAIRRGHESPSGYGGVEAFHVSNVHDFARKLIEQGARERGCAMSRRRNQGRPRGWRD